MAKEIKCPWCGEVVTEPKVKRPKSDYGRVVERRCSKCGKVLAAYLEKEGEFFQGMRAF
jgi:phage FluMu protein Com